MKRSHLIIIGIGLVILALSIFIRSAGLRISDVHRLPTAEQSALNLFPPGTRARLIYQDFEKMPVYVDEACFWNAQNAIRRNDKTELARIVLDGEVEMLPVGTVVTVRSYDARGVSEIELDGGGHRWIMNKLLHK